MTPKKFRFPLQKLLNLRQFAEDRARVELGKAVSEVERINQDLHGNAEKRAALSRFPVVSGQGQPSEAVHVGTLLSVARYAARLDAERERLIEDLAAAETVAESKRKADVECAKNVKILENLKEKKLSDWRKERADAQDNETDDIVNSN